MTQNDDRAAHRRVEIEAMLADYPEIPGPQLDELRHYFRKEASAMDVALISGNGAIETGYRRFRADHVDRISAQDWTRAILILLAIAAAIVAVGYLSV